MGYQILASSNSWIEGEAIKQMEVSSKLEGMHQVIGMPDLHPGKGFPVGAVFLCDYIYPSLVGSDIGCGMTVSKINIEPKKIKISQWVKKIAKIESEEFKLDHFSLIQEICQKFNLDHEPALGTVGGGNHFVEIQKIIDIKNLQIAQKNNLSINDLLLIVHTGSRGLGAYILQEYQKDYGFNPIKDKQAQHIYMDKHQKAYHWASANRAILNAMVAQALNFEVIPWLEIVHNYVEFFENQYLHRKGAASSNSPCCQSHHVGFIPSSRGEVSYLIEPFSNPSALSSLPHGAGRKWKRGDCKARLSDYSIESFRKTKLGSFVVCGDKDLLFEEAPQAYKKISQVIEDVETYQLGTVVAITQPILTYKCPEK